MKADGTTNSAKSTEFDSLLDGAEEGWDKGKSAGAELPEEEDEESSCADDEKSISTRREFSRKALRALTTTPGRVQDIFTYVERKKRRVVYLKTVQPQMNSFHYVTTSFTFTVSLPCFAGITSPNPGPPQYYKLLVLVGIFYVLPSAQFVFFQYKQQDVTGYECYYNFKCAHSFLVPSLWPASPVVHNSLTSSSCSSGLSSIQQ